MARQSSAMITARIDKWFPEREFSVRSNGETRSMTVKPGLQMTVAGLAVAAMAWAGTMAVASHLATPQNDQMFQLAASAPVFIAPVASAQAPATPAANTINHARLAALREEGIKHREARQKAEERFARLTERHAEAVIQLQQAVDEAEKARALAATAKSRAAMPDRTAPALQSPAIETSSDAAAQVAALMDREARLREALDNLGLRLSETARERDAAIAAQEEYRLDAANARIDLRLTREHQENVLSQLATAARASLGEMQGVLKRTGVDVDTILDAVDREYGGAGGPFIPLPPSVDAPEGYGIAPERSGNLLNDLSRLNSMRIAVQQMPLAKPLRIYRLTSRYGPRRDPQHHRRAMHKGIDLGAPTGTPVHTTGPGEIFFAGWAGGYGNVIKVRHPLGFTTIYAHLSRIDVAEGDTVEKGQVIGRVGNTGRSFGSHLHYEIRRGGKALNPESFIEAGRNVL